MQFPQMTSQPNFNPRSFCKTDSQVGKILTLKDIWQCLEAFLVVTTVGRG